MYAHAARVYCVCVCAVMMMNRRREAVPRAGSPIYDFVCFEDIAKCVCVRACAKGMGHLWCNSIWTRACHTLLLHISIWCARCERVLNGEFSFETEGNVCIVCVPILMFIYIQMYPAADIHKFTYAAVILLDCPEQNAKTCRTCYDTRHTNIDISYTYTHTILYLISYGFN